VSATAPEGQTVLILGGGVGGVVTANRLRRNLDKRHRIILVNRDPNFTFAASYLWVMSGDRRAEQITRPLNRLKKRGIEVVIGEIESIDPIKKSAVIAGREIAADHLVVTLGADYATDSIPGLADAGLTFATLAGAQALAPRLKGLDTGKVLVVTAAPLYRCPAAPYEAAFLIDAALRSRGVRKRVDLSLRSAEPGPMGVAGANVSTAVATLLGERGIKYTPSSQILAAEPGRADFADGQSESFDLLVYMPPIAPPSVVRSSPLAGLNGWIAADPHTLTTEFSNVYAIGDNVQIPLSIGKPLPRAGAFAHKQGQAVADNIAAAINGRPQAARFDGHGGCFIETGFGRAGYGTGNFYAQPSPAVAVKPPSRRQHLGKVLFEQLVLRHWL